MHATDGCSRLYAGQQFGLAGETAAAVVTSTPQDVAQRPIPPWCVYLTDDPLLSASVAGDPQEPRGESTERLVEGLGGRG